jgi:replicative DNA helicase
MESLKKVKDIKDGKIEPGYKAGFKELDDITGGVREGELIILAARPSIGKTSLALSMSKNLQEPNVFFSVEMPKGQLGMKLKSLVSRVALFKLRNGFLSDDEYSKLQQATNSASNLPIHIDDTPAINVIQLRGKLRKLIKKYGTKVVFIDYLQLMKGHKKVQSRVQEIASISASLKELAKELKVAIIALSQLSRYVEQRKGSRPMLSDLRESGAIEQDADMVLFLYRGEVYEETPENKGVAEIIVGKQRNGPTTTVEVNFDKNTTLFYNKGDSPDSEERF